MTLLKKLQSALAPIYGNVMLIDEPEKDLYHCPLCFQKVTEDKWNQKHQCCFQCFYNESDRTRADDGDEPVRLRKD